MYIMTLNVCMRRQLQWYSVLTVYHNGVLTGLSVFLKTWLKMMQVFCETKADEVEEMNPCNHMIQQTGME
jgi:hypothetical protein